MAERVASNEAVGQTTNVGVGLGMMAGVGGVMGSTVGGMMRDTMGSVLDNQGAAKVVETLPCTKCGGLVPSNAKFCSECGAPFIKKCPECNTDVPPGAKFCLECGHKLL